MNTPLNGAFMVPGGPPRILPIRREVWPVRGEVCSAFRQTLCAAVLRRRHAGALLERAVEGPDRSVAAFERDAEDRQLLARQPRHCFLQPVVVQKIVEVAVAE